jgi:Protein of unknown function (DUF3592)
MTLNEGQGLGSLHVRWLLGLLLCTLAWLPGSLQAAPLPPPQITHVPAEVAAGDSVMFRITVANPTAQTVSPMLFIDWPDAAYPIALDGLQQVEYDYAGRKLRGIVELPSGASRMVELRMLGARDAAGTRLNLTARLNESSTETDHWERHALELQRRPDTRGVLVGGLRVMPAAFVVLAWFLACLLLWVLLYVVAARRPATTRRVPGGAAGTTLALMLPVAFWLVFAEMAWRDWRILQHWTACEATVLGGRLVEQANTPTGTRPATSSSSRSSFTPELALRYQVDGRDQYSTGFDSGSSLRRGGRSGSAGQLANWQVGTKVPCWYDPAQPDNVVVERGFGGAYLFLLLTLPVFWLGLYLARRLLRG